MMKKNKFLGTLLCIELLNLRQIARPQSPLLLTLSCITHIIKMDGTKLTMGYGSKILGTVILAALNEE